MIRSLLFVAPLVGMAVTVLLLRRLLQIRREHPEAFSPGRSMALFRYWGGLLVLGSALTAVVGTVFVMQARIVQPPAPESGPVPAGAVLEIPHYQGFDGLVWGAGESLDPAAVTCRRVARSSDSDNGPVPVHPPEGWPADVAVPVQGRNYVPVTSTDVFDGRRIRCTGGGLTAYLSTSDPGPAFKRTVGWVFLGLSPVLLLAGIGVRLITRSALRAAARP